MTKIDPAQSTELDLNISMVTFAVPGAGALGADDGGDDDGDDKKGPLTAGTTCWGTPCPSANTISC